MKYKDSKFEIDDRQFKFKNGLFWTFLIIFISIFASSLSFSKGNIYIVATSSFVGVIIGVIIGILVLRLFVGMYLKNTIDLSDIE